MADVKQAVIWMQEGKSVRRASWPESAGELVVYTQQSATNMMLVTTKERPFVSGRVSASVWCATISSILADDWEIAE